MVDYLSQFDSMTIVIERMLMRKFDDEISSVIMDYLPLSDDEMDDDDDN